MIYEPKQLQNNESDFSQLHYPHQLTLEEKDELLFVLLEHLQLRVMRAHFDDSLTILTPVKE